VLVVTEVTDTYYDTFTSAFVTRILKEFFSALSAQQKILAEFGLSRILGNKLL